MVNIEKYSKNPPDAVIIGLGINGLGVARALSQANLSVLALIENKNDIAAATRCANVECIKQITGPALIENLVTLGKMLSGKPVLFLTTEDAVMQVADNQEALKPYFHFTMPAKHIMESLQDKAGIAAFAEQAKTPQPNIAQIANVSDVKALSQFNSPLILKPSYRDPAYDGSFKKAYLLDGLDDVESLCVEILPVHSPLILQEYIPGDDDAIYFCLIVMDTNSNVIASYTGQKTTVWPPKVGGTAACAPAMHYNDELTALSQNLLSAAGYSGMAGVEFKRDNRDGKFYLIEPTVGRTDYQAELATLNGNNLPEIYVRMLRKEKIPAQNPLSCKAWQDPMAAYAGAKFNKQDNKLQIKSSLFRWTDPVPAFQFFMKRIKNKFC